MKKYEIEVEKVEGYCSCGYSPGDKFYAEGLKTQYITLRKAY